MKFKDIVGYEGLYEISENGVVKTYPKYVNSKANSRALKKAKIMKKKINQDGYESIALVDNNGVRKTHLVHRLVALTYIPNPIALPQVNHKNNIKTDNRVDNLKWGTTLSNSREAFQDGLYKIKKGSELKHAKLNESQILFI